MEVKMPRSWIGAALATVAVVTVISGPTAGDERG
jgi:hypothetical protein